MLDLAFKGSKRYWRWLIFLLAIIGVGAACYLLQLREGLKITGMSRDVSWGFYIGQFTFLVGVAASAVMVVLPYYLHNVKEFGRITILGEDVPPPKWVKPLIYVSIPWAISIHTVTAFLYAGLPGRHYWLTAIMAARFLASAFCSGPALLIILCFLVKKYTKFDPGDKAINKLSNIVTYALLVSVFFVLLEVFTAFYSQVPGHMHGLEYLFVGLHGHGKLVPFMWLFTVLCIVAVALLINPNTRKKEKTLLIACVATFFAMWLEKGIALVVTGFIPNPFEQITEYMPTAPELAITLAVWATGFLILTVLYKVAISVKEEIEGL